LNIYIAPLKDSEVLPTQASDTTSKQDSLQAFRKNGKRKQSLGNPLRRAWLRRDHSFAGCKNQWREAENFDFEKLFVLFPMGHRNCLMYYIFHLLMLLHLL